MAFTEADLLPTPLALFRRWFAEAGRAGVPEPEAMTLATADRRGQPYARIVLLKDAAEEGFSFYTNFESDKGRQILANNQVALLFFWPQADRQVRIRGRARPVPAAVADRYFASRPRNSQLGAWTSPQSQTIPDRAFLEKRFAEVAATYAGKAVPRPPHWSGFVVRPDAVEFWQRGADRLHDRFVYERSGAQAWSVRRLAP